MRDETCSSAGRRRPSAAFAAAFAGVFLLGTVVIGVEFLELHQQPVKAKVATRPVAARPVTDDRLELATNFRESRERTAKVRRQADATVTAVFQFLNDRFVDASEQAAAEPRPVPKPEPIRWRAAPSFRPNPEWVAMKSKLTAMQQQRDELLVKLTESHPTVRALDGQITATLELLAAMPAEFPVEVTELPVEKPVERAPVPPPVAETHAAPSPPSPEMQRAYRNLLLAAGHARDNYRSAVEAETAKWDAYQRGGSPPIVAMNVGESTDLRQPEGDFPSIASINGPFPIGAVAILTLLSFFAGVLAYRRVEQPTLTFVDTAEIESVLGLPVLGRFGEDADLAKKDAA